MEKGLKIGEFAKLTGVTVKTVLHYHKVGLLAEVPRTDAGYRLYGAAELTRMLSIKRLKSLGLNLEQIREVLGKPEDGIDLHSVLLAIQVELQKQIDALQQRVGRIQRLLEENYTDPTESTDESPSFKMVVDILGEEAAEQYANTCPEMFDLERRMYSVIDDLDWGIEIKDSFRMVAEYFRDNPEQYQASLDFGPKITALGDLDPKAPEVDELARNYSSFIKSLPFCTTLLNQEAVAPPLESMFAGIMAEFMTPAQVRLLQLLGEYLAADEGPDTREGGQNER